MAVTIEALTQHNKVAAQQFVLQLLTELGGEEQQEDAYVQAIDAFFNNPKSVDYVAKHENDYVGVMTAIESMAIYAQGTYGVIQELFVLPTARSLAVGQQLMIAMKEHAKHVN